MLANVPNLGFDTVTSRSIIAVFLCVSVNACTSQKGQEFFCESYAQDSMTNVYKQQIIRLTEQEFCVIWPVDSSQCGTPNQPTMTQWLDLKEASTQVRGHLQTSLAVNQVSLDILPFVRKIGDASNGVAVPTEQMHFVFRPSDAVLRLTEGNSDNQTMEFVCKPWVKQKWWAIY